VRPALRRRRRRREVGECVSFWPKMQMAQLTNYYVVLVLFFNLNFGVSDSAGFFSHTKKDNAGFRQLSLSLLFLLTSFHTSNARLVE
jgi:hypothetical protein